ncbi:MAG TPA: nicotinate-nucleotide adenylyltransferase [Candidatus Dormibacteraeota bacterium]|nr:nicotinate-nucleotide adenylyltransferase [Candidatus Dormibacteraeota bacterium]
MSRPAVLVAPRAEQGARTSVRRGQRTKPRREVSGPRVERIGVLGGTFDPPHIGHLWLATMAADALELDRVLFMPAAQPPHKRRGEVSSAAERLLLTRIAIDGDPTFALSPIEMERPGPSFTVDSVEELLRLYPDVRLYLLMAADALAGIDTWREPERLLALVEWAVGPRAGSGLPDRDELRRRFGAAAARIHLLEGPTLDVSASEIRRRVAAGQAIRYLVPRAVEELIIERGLYRPGEG